jgi:hypothetical protein
MEAKVPCSRLCGGMEVSAVACLRKATGMAPDQIETLQNGAAGLGGFGTDTGRLGGLGSPSSLRLMTIADVTESAKKSQEAGDRPANSGKSAPVSRGGRGTCSCSVPAANLSSVSAIP